MKRLFDDKVIKMESIREISPLVSSRLLENKGTDADWRIFTLMKLVKLIKS